MAARKNQFRKRFLVSEGDLMQLWFEICQVRDQEKRKLFKQSFKALLAEATPVKIVPIEKGGQYE